MEDKNLTRNILIISAIVIALCIGVGFSFAYFTANIKGNDEAGENIVNAGKMQVTYIDGNLISLDRMKPSDTLTKKFQVKNTGDFPAKYNVKIDEVTNTLVDKTDLRYTLKKNGSEVKKGIVPSGSAYLLTDISIDATETPDEYELIIEFVDTHNNQNDNQGKTFSGKIQIDKEADVILATNPEVKLYQGLIPIDFDGSGNVITADTSDKWYDYTVQEWANAVLVDRANYEKYISTPNQIIPMEDILQMYVYIPRYKYQLFNVNNEGVPKQVINIQFEDGTNSTGDIECKYTNEGNGTITEDCTNIQSGEKAQNGEWYTHPAFTFGDTELPGIWVGKFEPSDPTDNEGKNNNTIGGITILPNKVSMTIKDVKVMFDSIRDIDQDGNKYNLNAAEIDTHMMKNSEWGAVAYLSQSIYGIFTGSKQNIICNITGEKGTENCSVWNNNTSSGEEGAYGTITGCVESTQNGTAISNIKTCPLGYEWNNSGINRASTTANIYGIYDMAGGMWEYVMGNMVDTNGAFNVGDLGLTNKTFNVDAKYYDSYTYDLLETSHSRGHLGDTTRETLEIFDNNVGSWNNDYSFFPEENNSWFIRGGRGHDLAGAGIFAYFRYGGAPSGDASFRVVLTAQ